jgi:protein-tyrosine phosphatase
MTKNNLRIAILFVCMGNICRSPAAEGIFRRMVADAELDEVIEIDSTGTHSYHTGLPADERMRRVARSRGY